MRELRKLASIGQRTPHKPQAFGYQKHPIKYWARRRRQRADEGRLDGQRTVLDAQNNARSKNGRSLADL